MKWRCGYCDNINHRTEVYSFLSKCQKCGREPKSFVCPHCGEKNALDKDKDRRNPACEAVASRKPVPPIDLNAQKRREHEARKEELEREIDLAKLAAILAQTKALAEAQKEKPASEKVKEDVRKFVEHMMGFHLAVKEVRSELAVRCKDDPDALAMLNEALDKYLEDHS
jgi:type II secretory pathway component HofQ